MRVGRSARLPQILLGILKAGGAYLPLDPAYPAERVAYILQDSGARLVLDEGLDWVAVAGQPSSPPLQPTHPGQLAYLLYTSGSTGAPKGVMLTHADAVAFISWARQEFRPQQLARVLASTSICFDLSVFELFAPLCAGGTVVLLQDAMALAASDLGRGLTLANGVPSALQEMVHGGGLPATLQVASACGEPLPAALVGQLRERAPGGGQ